MWNTVRKPILSCAILAYLWIVIAQVIPDLPFKKVLYAPLKGTVDALGLWQNFGLFVPNPPSNNAYIDAIVKCSDGSLLVWNYPRMERMSLLEKLPKERFRKYGCDHLYYANERVLWPDLARYVARQYSSNQQQPIEIVLRRHWVDISPPGSTSGKLEETFGDEPFYTLKVTPGDLR